MRFLFIYICLWPLATLHAQIRFQALKVEDGLSQSSVNFVIRDKKGYYWIGTQYGLNRFDGKTINTYYTQNEQQLADNYLINALEDDFGNIWFGTRNNLSRYNPTLNAFTKLNPYSIKEGVKGHNAIYFLFKDPLGHIWFNDAGRFLRILKREQNETYPKPKIIAGLKEGSQLAFFDEGILYSICNDTLLKYNYTESGAQLLKSKPILGLKKTEYKIFTIRSKTWILNANKLYEIQNDSLVEQFKEVSSQTTINDVLYKNQRYWIGTDNGLYEFSERGQWIALHQNHIENRFSLSENKVLSVSYTNDELLWIGTANKGVNSYNKSSSIFNVIKQFPNKPYIPLCCLLDSDSMLYVGKDGGVDVFEQVNKQFKYVKTVFENHKVTALLKHRQTLFMGTTNGLFIEQKGCIKPIALSKTTLAIADLKVSHSGDILVATHQGLYIVESNTHRVLYVINRLTRSSTGQAFMASSYLFNTQLGCSRNYFVNTTFGSIELDSLYRFKQLPFKNYPYYSLSEIMITGAIEKPNGSVWYGTLGNGVYKQTGNTFQVFNQNKGLSNNVVAALVTDTNGFVWASTNQGINCIKNDTQVVAYTNALQLESAEFVSNGSYALNNQLFFCSNSGVLSFNANDVLNQSLTDSLQLNTALVLKNYTDTLNPNASVELLPKDKVVTLRFEVPSYKFHDKVKLAYQLQGFDETWHYIKNGQDITLTSLPYGTYTLLVKARLTEFNWQQQFTKTIIIHPPFWRKTWFIILLSSLLLTLFILSIWYISQMRLKKQVLQLQIHQTVLNEKERISRDLHDNIGSQISTLISGLDKIHLQNKTDMAEKLSDQARQTLNELRETIWALNTDVLTLESLRQKLEDYIFEWRTVKDEVNIVSTYAIQTNHELPPQQILAVYRIAQEAISNALKHAGATQLSVALTQLHSTLQIIITDNGIGFDVDARKQGHFGLDNMQLRAEQSKIKYTIHSKIGEGTLIIITLVYK